MTRFYGREAVNYQDAERLLGRIHYKPDWTLTAFQPWYAEGSRGGSRMQIELRCIVPNSSNWPRYQGLSQAGGVFEIDLDRIHTEDEFYRVVLNNIIAWETHEAREFFRIGSGYYAPFHPHRPDGNHLWDSGSSTHPAQTLMVA